MLPTQDLEGQTGARVWPGPPAASGLSRPQLARVVEFIEGRLDEALTLPEVAAISGLSPSHFARQFKATTGLPPHQYIIAERIRRAMRLLSLQDQPIADVAFACGFTHQEHMTRLFRRATGTTPASYRRSLLKQAA